MSGQFKEKQLILEGFEQYLNFRQQEPNKENLMNVRGRFSNITGGWTGGWKRDMELRVRGPKSWDPVLFGVGAIVMGFVGFLKYPTSTSILKVNVSRRSIALWTDG